MSSYYVDRETMKRRMPGFVEWDAEVMAVAPEGYALCYNVVMTKPELVHVTYPQEWVEYYNRWYFILRDPVLLWASFNNGRTRWSDVKIPFIHKRVMDVANSHHNLKFGGMFACLNNEPLRRKCFLSVARSDRELTDQEMARVEDLFHVGLQEMRNTEGLHYEDDFTMDPGLSNDEIAVLKLCSEGKTHREIATILNVAPDTVKKRTDRAREKLSAENTTHAVTKAISPGLLEIWPTRTEVSGQKRDE